MTREGNKMIEQDNEIKRPTPEEIEAARTPNGGWTRETLRSWGVSWPPKNGWKRELERNHQQGN
jgi:hypothetical protein